ncbi:putative inactive receptor kinase At5g67200 [Silene latifolia]|uniref:putative inactive receptor kinase At5g67200 n=1 Tax=Silene latifolia TaxID=37657 RepID=UPI003D770867
MQYYIIFIFLIPLLSYSAYAKPSNDAQAILHFQQKADINNKLHFHTNISHCQWQGVQCLNNRVVRFVVEGENLGGILVSDSLSRLDQLRVLSLKNDSLNGPVPDLSALYNLKGLYLEYNHFTGRFPASIKTLHRIRTIDLSRNNFTEELPTWLAGLDRLYCLRVEFNKFTGTIPVFNQTTLLVFNVSNNNLRGPIPVTPTLSRFNPSSFSHNRGLCGRLVRRECRPGMPFFDAPAGAPGPLVHGQAPPPLSTPVVRKSHSVDKRHVNKAALVVGFVTGVIVLIGSVICFVMAVKKGRRVDDVAGTMESDYSAAINAAAVMMLEEEREEKVKSAQQQMTAVKEVEKAGNLVFCGGETPVYTVEQLMRASAELLGRGTIGTTYKAVVDNSLIVCVKRIDGGKMGGVAEDVFQRHMESVGALRHPNLVPLRCFFQAKDEKLLVYDYQPNGSLFSLIHGSKSARAKPLHWTSCLKIAEDVAQGLSYIHQAWRLVHGNLKSTNVLLGSDFEACITDYCLNVLTDQSLLENDPTLIGYKAPETRVSNSEATPKSDVYAFGVLLLELLTGKPPSEHPGLTPKDIAQWVRAAREVEDGGVDENRLVMLLEVAIACSAATPEHRPNMWQVLKMLQEIKEAVLMDVPELSPEHGMP